VATAPALERVRCERREEQKAGRSPARMNPNVTPVKHLSILSVDEADEKCGE